MSDQPAPPDSSAVDAALEELREALEQERRENDTEMTAATQAFNTLKAAYDDQSTKYSWAEKQRQEFWRLYNWLLNHLGVPRQPGSRPYTLEEFQAELAKLPAKPSKDVSKLAQERDAALARAERAEAELATLKEQQGQAVGLQVKLKKAMTDKGIKLP